jgi:hypothetical protein
MRNMQRLGFAHLILFLEALPSRLLHYGWELVRWWAECKYAVEPTLIVHNLRRVVYLGYIVVIAASVLMMV